MNRKANGMIVGLVVVLIVLGVVAFAGSTLFKTTPPPTATPTAKNNNPDIDRSGAADESDRMLIKAHLDCLKTQPCWNTTIGKTKDGDNPLYVFDLDLNGDGFISSPDADLVK